MTLAVKIESDGAKRIHTNRVSLRAYIFYGKSFNLTEALGAIRMNF